MARTTMAALISRVRDLIGDTAGTAQVWTDNQVQTFMDRRSMPLDFVMLTPAPTVAAGGTAQYFTYRAEGYGNFESTDAGTVGFVVQDGTGNRQGTSGWAAVDYENGQITFTTDRKGTAYFITTYSYDIYGAASDILRSWAAKKTLEFSFSADGATFNRNQQFEALNTLADLYARQAWPTVIANVRSDINTGDPDAPRRVNV